MFHVPDERDVYTKITVDRGTVQAEVDGESDTGPSGVLGSTVEACLHSQPRSHSSRDPLSVQAYGITRSPFRVQWLPSDC